MSRSEVEVIVGQAQTDFSGEEEVILSPYSPNNLTAFHLAT